MREKKPRSVTVRAYCCLDCGLIFRTTRKLKENETCKRCGGRLALFDEYKDRPRRRWRKRL